MRTTDFEKWGDAAVEKDSRLSVTSLSVGVAILCTLGTLLSMLAGLAGSGMVQNLGTLLNLFSPVAALLGMLHAWRGAKGLTRYQNVSLVAGVILSNLWLLFSVLAAFVGTGPILQLLLDWHLVEDLISLPWL